MSWFSEEFKAAASLWYRSAVATPGGLVRVRVLDPLVRLHVLPGVGRETAQPPAGRGRSEASPGSLLRHQRVSLREQEGRFVA